MPRQAFLLSGVLATLVSSFAALGCISTAAAADVAPQYPEAAIETGIDGLAPLDAAQLSEFRNAVRSGNVRVVKRLLDAGVNPNIRMENGDTAFTYAVRAETPAVAKELLAAKDFDINDPNRFGETPLMLAVFKGDETLFNALIEKGADPNAGSNWNPLLYAATEGRVDFIKRLLELGANPNVQTNAGVTPLIMAARKPSREAVVTLLRAGAWRDWCTERGDSPADFARRAGDEELAKYLAIPGCSLKGKTQTSPKAGEVGAGSAGKTAPGGQS